MTVGRQSPNVHVGAGEVVLDGTGLVGSIVRATSGEGPGSVLRGFVLQNGATGSDPIFPPWDYAVGGALYVHESSPTIEDCVFRNCAAGSGGAAFFFESDSLLTGCSFLDNVSNRNGGGLQLQRARVSVVDCTFIGNQATLYGGASHTFSGNPSFTGCVVTENESFTAGGGMNFSWNANASGNALVEDCLVYRNTSFTEGGGIRVDTEPGITPDWLLIQDTTVCNNVPSNVNDNASAPFVDLGGNQLCGCPGDLTYDAVVNGQDLTALLAKWGACTSDDPTACFADLDGDGTVGGTDLTIILSAWGNCG